MSEGIKAENSATTQTCAFVKQDEIKENCPELRESCLEWEKLPYPACVEIFHHLSDADRVTMAQVCKMFNDVFRDPSLWKKRNFYIDKNSDERNIQFTSVLGECMKDVRIEIWHDEHNSPKNISETFKILMENMKNARFRLFSLSFLALERFNKYPEQRDTIINCLIKMLQTQTDLKEISLSSCHFNLSTGTDVMNKMSTSLRYRLKCLNIENFLDRILNLYDLETFKETLTKFSNLTHITVNYSYLSDEVLRHWAVSLRHKLKSMRISATDLEPHTHTISSLTWRELTKSCPKLKVHFSTAGLSYSREILNLLQPGAPVYYVLMWATDLRNADKYVQFSRILKHLVTYFKDSLEGVHFSFGRMDYTPDNELVHLIKQCHQLQRFYYQGNCGIAVPNAICDRLKDSKSVLSKVFIALGATEFDLEIEKKINLLHVIFWDETL